MDLELEASFLNVNKALLRQTLKKLGAKLVRKERLMKRVVFDPPKKIKGGWLRVRDEGHKITMSIKQVIGKRITDQRECCLTIDNFNEGVRYLETIGAKRKSYQETLREDWHYIGAEISIDTWPGLHPFVEIEGKSEKQVEAVARKLGFDYSQAMFGAVDVKYEIELGIPAKMVNKIPEITFKNPPKKRSI